MFNKLKQIKDLRTKGKELQDALKKEQVEGSAGWGKVKITLDGTQRATAVEINEEVLANKEKLEGYVKEAINDGMDKMQKMMATKMKDLGGLDLAKEMQDLMGR